jgi:[glutamine synthetase] adenylyltransferase / [glutamine synthetase]-adenylyl-L-tyrosine phosphorylase
MQSILEGIEFRDRGRALGAVTRVFKSIPEELHSKFRYLLASSADPDGALSYLARFQQAQPGSFLHMRDNPSALQMLTSVFSHSNFLSEEILQHPGWVESLVNSNDLFRVLSREEYVTRFEHSILEGVPSPIGLALFRRRQLLRILIRDVHEYATLSEVTEEISNLADAILDITYRRIRAEQALRFGTPRCDDGSECAFSVVALGKLGGSELNYSSDIDLMFVYAANGQTDGAHSITNKEFFKKVATQYTELLSTYTTEGMCYRVDLRLRPDGRLGEVCLSLEGMIAYYENRARDWELQMLIKARVAAGDPLPGRRLLEFVEPKIYQSTLDFSAVEAVSEARERISERLAGRMANRQSRDTTFDVKLARGGIRDIEFLVQCLQRLHGGREPWVRNGGTLLALTRLRDKSLLSNAEYSRLASAYQFLRHLEHRLQFADDRQTHTLPTQNDELALVSQRMPRSLLGSQPSADRLLHQLNAHFEEVQNIYDRVIHAQQPLYYSPAPPASADETARPESAPVPETSATNLIRFLDQQAPGFASVIAEKPMRRGLDSFEHFLEKVAGQQDHLALLSGDRRLARDLIDLFEHSPHFADEINRQPEMIEDLSHIQDHLVPAYGDLAALLGDATNLRRFYRREMLRIQGESVCLNAPIFDTLQRTSDLADAAIAAAYKMAIRQTMEAHPTPGYHPADQMLVIAMGRLGMREFDLGSDADLNFVLPDEDAHELLFWTRVAERIIDLLTAYTGEGTLVAVDTRLRPNGNKGVLVQQVGTYKDYLATQAEAWEGITYMKSRALAGNAESATRFLHELQEVDWRRYGQGGRSRAYLRDMRERIEKEQGLVNPLKSGPGGYYDIDFALMYLRLKSAGIFFKVLNTPERIDVIEKMGHLEHEDAAFLLDAATFYRAIDHGLRVYSGHAEGRLPTSESRLEVLTNLVYRWTPEHLHDKPLPAKLAEIQQGTREYFRRLFG